MIYWILTCLSAFLLDIMTALGRDQADKDLEIVALRQQVRILERKLGSKTRISRAEKVFLAALADRIKKNGIVGKKRLGSSILLFKPDTVLKWHRELVRRKWTYRQDQNRGGRPKIDAEIEQLILDLAKENPCWGRGKIHGELLKLGFEVSEETVRNVLTRYGVPPAPERGVSTWGAFLNHDKTQMLACDSFTVETITLKTLYDGNWLRMYDKTIVPLSHQVRERVNPIKTLSTKTEMREYDPLSQICARGRTVCSSYEPGFIRLSVCTE